MDVPRPGKPVRGSQTGTPVMALLDLLGRRWAMRVIWELRDEPSNFRVLRERCGQISSSVLNQRLTELRSAGIVESETDGYRLTGEGTELLKSFWPLQKWAERWAERDSAGASID